MVKISTEKRSIVFINAADILSINITILNLDILNWNHGKECLKDYIKVSEANKTPTVTDTSKEYKICGSANGMYSYLTWSSAVLVETKLFPDSHQRSMLVMYHVVRSDIYYTYQLIPDIYHVGTPEANIHILDSLLLRQKHHMEAEQVFTYSFTAACDPGYQIKGNISGIFLEAKNISLYFHDGPMDDFPILYSVESEQEIKSAHYLEDSVLSAGPRMYIKLTLNSPNSPDNVSALSIQLHHVFINNTFVINISNKTVSHNFSCSGNPFLTQCIWVFTAMAPTKWISLDLHTLDLSLLHSYDCLNGIFAVYDHDYSVEDRIKIFQACFAINHTIQRSFVSASNRLVVILVSYHQPVHEEVKLGGQISPSICQGHFITQSFASSSFKEIIAHTYYLLHFKFSDRFYWVQGCLIVQKRTPLKIPNSEHYALFLEPYGSRIQVTYFEPFISANCSFPTSHVFNYDGWNFIKSVPADISFNSVSFMVQLLYIEFPRECPYYDALFNVRFEQQCEKHIFSGTLTYLPEFNSFSEQYQNTDFVPYCDKKSLEGAYDSDQWSLTNEHSNMFCGSFRINQTNRFIHLAFSKPRPQLSDEFSPTNIYRISSTIISPIKPGCDDTVFHSCFIGIEIFLNNMCIKQCRNQTKFVIQHLGRKNTLYVLHISPGQSKFYIPVKSIYGMRFIIHPVTMPHCDCEIRFKYFLQINHWFSKSKLDTSSKRIFNYKHKRYFIQKYVSHKSWEAAEQMCQSKISGHLWTISDNNELYSVLDMYTAKFFLGEGMYNTIVYIGLKNNKVMC